MRPLLLLLPILSLVAAEPPRWAGGQGLIGGLEATPGQEIPQPTTLVAGTDGARIDLGDQGGGEILLGPGAVAVFSIEDGVTILNLQGAAQITRTSATTDFRLRLPTGELAVAEGLVVGESLPTGAVVVAIRGSHRGRATASDLPRQAWTPLPAGQAAAVDTRGLRSLGVQRRPQILATVSLADQVSGRALAPASGITDLDDADRDDLALALVTVAAGRDPGAALRQIRFLAGVNRPMALAAAQILLIQVPSRAEEVLVALVDGGVAAERAAGIAAFCAPDRAVAVARRALALKPANTKSIIRLVAAAAPAQAAAVEALAPQAP